MQRFKNLIFFFIYLILNPHLIVVAIQKKVYLPVYTQFEWLKKYSISTIVDVGAHRGRVLHSLSILFPKASLYSFEPNTENHRFIKGLVPQTILAPYALSNKKVKASFFKHQFSELSSLLSIDKNYDKYPVYKNVQKITIQTTTLDHFFKNKELKDLVLLKIDTQGSEGLVLQGGKKFLKQVALIHIETSVKPFYNRQWTFDRIYIYLKSLGFIYLGTSQEAFFYPLFEPDEQVNSIFVNSCLLI